jgi:transposase
MASEGIISPLPKSLYPPAYSPDLSAIDQFFTELEVLLRKAGDRQEKPWDERRGLGH